MRSSFQQVWHAYIQGPSGSAYTKGVFLVTLLLPDNYPQAPPACCFVTQVFHPNIAIDGRVAFPLIDPMHWTEDTCLADVLQQLRALLAFPELDIPAANAEARAEYDSDRWRFEARAHAWTREFA
ncbi:unnamed protein product, partial [Phaeothamnion confervicola]